MNNDQDKNQKKQILKGPSLGFTDNLSKREMWKQIAAEQNGRFEIRHTTSHDLEMHIISIPHKQWTINISISDSRPLKVQVSFTPSLDFNFNISPIDITDRIFKVFRKGEVNLGWNEFDKHYMIKTNRTDLVKKLFSKEIQKTMLGLKIYSVLYKSSTNTRSAELMSLIQRHAGNKQMMLELTEMFRSLIDNFEKFKIIHQ